MKSLASAYRPQEFEEVVGQEVIVKILQRQIESGNIRHAYMFTGASGTGKTTLAKVLAKSINGSADDVIEVDAASNNGVENMRNLVEEARQRSVSSKYKVYIIDEAHSLTGAAWQPLLNILEKPPEYTIFIFCTTDPQKVPATIMNRMQRFNFTKIPANLIKERLKYVCEQEGYLNYEDSIEYISIEANGCMREALTLLEKVADYSTTFSIQSTVNILGVCSYETYFDLINAMIDRREKDVLSIISSVYGKGIDLKLFIDRFLEFVIDIAKYILFGSCDVISIPASMENEIKNAINIENAIKYYNDVMDKLLELKNMLKNEVDVKSVVEVVCLQIARL